ncbi:MAG: 4-(cytidine 5'-diphospho)-2-C-methyl-D-erythritol kinase [Candidatus Nanopelagicales bacterium]|nr:4-(cytidine 5'-diphospho)-2-C-methyl-D-erythritol kinase [Candidatus Nanopelagicales bacterium]
MAMDRQSGASVTVRVPAKVNLQLAVGPRRADGYHELATVFHAVSLFDDVRTRQVAPGSGISLTISGEGVSELPLDETNLAWRAALLLAEHAGVSADVELHLHKGIPVAGGMAGGSADAAGVLVACDALWQLGLSREELMALAAQLGSDVPFAVHGGTAIGTGRGEQLLSALSRGVFEWVFALADKGLSTTDIYAECDRLRGGKVIATPVVPPEIMQALRAGDALALGAALYNDLQAAAISLRPVLAQVLEVGEVYGALGAIVSGSGPTCAFLAADEEQALDIAVGLTSAGVCRTVKRATGAVPGARIVA